MATTTRAPGGAGPSIPLYLTEPARGLADLAFLPLAAGWLASAPRGDGHGVLVLPGLLASDMSTTLLRRYAELAWLRRAWLAAWPEPGPDVPGAR